MGQPGGRTRGNAKPPLQAGHAELWEREREFGRILDHSGVGAQWLAPDGTILWASKSELERLGYSEDEYVNHAVAEFLPDAGVADGLLDCLRSGRSVREHNARFICRTGEVRHLLIDMEGVWQAGALVCLRCLTRDVTDRVIAEDALRESEERYRAFIRNSSEGIWRVELDHPIDPSWTVDEQVERAYDWAYLAECNDAMAKAYGCDTAANLTGVRLAELFVRSDPQNDAFLRSFIRSNYELREAESHERDLYGNDRYFVNSFIGILEDGFLVRAWGTQRDITEQRKTEGALRKSQERFSRFMNHLPGAAWIKDLQGQYVYANPEAERIFGTAFADLQGKTDFEIFPPDIAAQFAANDQAALQSASGLQTLETLVHEDGVHESIVSKFLFSDERGGPPLIGGVAIDITEQRRAEVALRDSEQRLRLAADAGKVGLWDWDIPRNQVVWSDRIYEFHGVARESFGGRSEDFAALVHKDDRERVMASIAAALEAGVPYDIEFRTVRPGGEVRWLSTSASVLYDNSAKPVRMFGAVLDITERRHYEERLRRSNEELEEFAFVASHDLKEPLRMVNAYAELLVRRCATSLDRDSQLYKSYIQDGVKRMEALIDDLLSYSRVIHSGEQEETADLMLALKKALDVLEPQIAATDAEVSWETMPVVRGEVTQFEQVFQNLIGNSLKYRRTSERPRVAIRTKEDDGKVVVSVIDNGIGFEPRYADRIFGLFKRLHQHEYPGTGLGLAICKRIIERCGGTIWCESTPGKGSTFSFSLPELHGSNMPSSLL